MSHITLQNLCWQTPNQNRLLNNVTLAIGPGFTGLVGRNGSEKTTLLNLIVGRLTPLSGSIRVAGSAQYLRQSADPVCPMASLFACSDTPIIDNFSLHIRGNERVAISGRNRAVKSTLFQLIAGILQPDVGTISMHVNFVLLGQTVSFRGQSGTLLESYQRPHPWHGHNAAFQLLILDEPTNHLDIDAMEALEQGLSGFDSAILVASHDPIFIRKTGVTRRIGMDA